jgi:hypothetical protein
VAVSGVALYAVPEIRLIPNIEVVRQARRALVSSAVLLADETSDVTVQDTETCAVFSGLRAVRLAEMLHEAGREATR